MPTEPVIDLTSHGLAMFRDAKAVLDAAMPEAARSEAMEEVLKIVVGFWGHDQDASAAEVLMQVREEIDRVINVLRVGSNGDDDGAA